MGSIALIGLKHSGKSNHARRLAEYLGLRFFDLDDCILRAHPNGKSIRQLYAERGEAWFRRAEMNALEQLPREDHVLATGGGTMENQPLMRELRARKTVLIFLDVPENLLFERIEKKGLPPF